MKVKVRYTAQEPKDGFVLGDFPPSEIDSIVRVIKEYGVQAYIEKDLMLEANSDTYLDSQWYIDGKENYFEIILG